MNTLTEDWAPRGDFIIICEQDGTIIEVSQVGADIFNPDGGKLLGGNIESLAPHWQSGASLKQRRSSTKALDTEINDTLLTLSHPSGDSDFAIAAVLIPLFSDGQIRYAVVPRAATPGGTQTDSSELAAQMELSRSLVRGVEASLTQASQDIHDGVSQSMSNAVQILQAVGGTSKKLEASDRDRISRVMLMLREGIADARNISRQLMPASLARVGLAKNLKFEFENLELVGVVGSFSFTVPNPIPQHVEITLYRIASEALLNVKKHAYAGGVTLQVKSNGPLITMTISDDGIGFERLGQDDGTQTRVGLLSMEARARLIGGTFDLVTSPGNGTLITVELPSAGNTGSTPSNESHSPSLAITPKKRVPSKRERT